MNEYTDKMQAAAAKPTTPATKNTIIPGKKVDEIITKLDGLIIDLDSVRYASKRIEDQQNTIRQGIEDVKMGQIGTDSMLESRINWTVVRDVIQILLLALLLALVGYNTTQFWNWG